MEVILKMKQKIGKYSSGAAMALATVLSLMLLLVTVKAYADEWKEVNSVAITSRNGRSQNVADYDKVTDPHKANGDSSVDIVKVSIDGDSTVFTLESQMSDNMGIYTYPGSSTIVTLDGKRAEFVRAWEVEEEVNGFEIKTKLAEYRVSSSNSSSSSSSSSSKKKSDDDKKSNNETHDTASWVLNPNEMNIGYFIPAAAFPGTYRMGKQEQGPVAKTVFASATPAGWKEAFTFNLTKDGKADASVKSGQMKVTIPSQFIKAGRQFAILALDKSGNIHTYPDTDASDGTVSANINFEGYAFSLVYKD